MTLWEVLFPTKCVGCSRYGRYICSDCLNKIRANDQQLCPVCCRPAMFGVTHPKCRKRNGLDGLVVCLCYQGLVRRVVGKLKYHLVSRIIDELVEVVISTGQFEPLMSESWVVVGVPLSAKRMKFRGFNQADELARRIANYFGWQFSGKVLARPVHRQPQVGLTAKQRQANVKGVFSVNQTQLVVGKSILVIDDIWTTGSTLRECGRVLKLAGAKKVWGFTIAR